MTRIRSLKLVLAALLLASFAAACGGSSSGGSTQQTGSGPSTSSSGNSIMISNFMFKPMTMTVKVGTTVTWTNEDPVAHTVTSIGGGPMHSKDLNKGQSYSVKFTKAGTYQYLCAIHNYMKGTITVTS